METIRIIYSHSEQELLIIQDELANNNIKSTMSSKEIEQHVYLPRSGVKLFHLSIFKKDLPEATDILGQLGYDIAQESIIGKSMEEKQYLDMSLKSAMLSLLFFPVFINLILNIFSLNYLAIAKRKNEFKIKVVSIIILNLIVIGYYINKYLIN